MSRESMRKSIAFLEYTNRIGGLNVLSVLHFPVFIAWAGLARCSEGGLYGLGRPLLLAHLCLPAKSA